MNLPNASTKPVWIWALLLTALVSLPALFVGFTNDDLVHRLFLEHAVPGYAGGWFGLYDFTPPSFPTPALIERGLLPWFTSPDLSLRFLRPLSSLTLALDDAWFGRQALPAHLHSLLWMGLLDFFVAKLYLRWFPRRAAWLSIFVFVLSGVHGVPTAWLAARNTLVAAALGALSLWAWARFREEQWRAGMWIAPLALGASLLASESALVAVVLLVGYELGTRGLRRGVWGAAPHLLLGLAYLGAYAAFGYGARGSSFYVSPFDAPLRYLERALFGVPSLLVELLTGVPAAIGGLIDGAALPFMLVGWAALLGYSLLLYALRWQLPASSLRTLLWLSLSTCLSLGTLVGAVVTGRVLPLPLLGSAALVGNLLSAAWAAARRPVGASPAASASAIPSAGGRKRWLLACGVLALFHFGLSPLVRVSSAAQFGDFARAQERLALDADVGTCGTSGQLYLVNAADPILALSAGPALKFYTPAKAGAESLLVLSMAPHAQRLRRIAANAFELTVLDPPRSSTPFEHLYRAPEQPLLMGQRYRVGGLSVLVLEATSGVFSRARFETAADLSLLNVCLMIWRDGKLQNLPWPAPGESTIIGYELGPMGM